MEDTYLFSLVAMSEAANRIVEANPQFHDAEHSNMLTFKATHRSKFPGHLLTFGRIFGFHDVYLPDAGYPMYQCAFYLLHNGELVFEDRTAGHHTRLHWYNERGEELEKHRLQGDPRCRVIPQAPARRIAIEFSLDTVFYFVWRQPIVQPEMVEQSKALLATFAQANVVHDHTALLAVPRNPNPSPTGYETASARAPVVPIEFDGKPQRQLHFYKEIGSGSLGKVYKAVDLATGSLWAVKECKGNDKSRRESWKTPLLKEVQKLAHLRHPNIIRIEQHQGWSEGWPVQIIFPLCDGNVRHLLPQHHRCKENSSAQEPWLTGFIDQVLFGLEYIHQNNMIHRDLKPENILFDRDAGPDGKVSSFYISDFGLVTDGDSLKRSNKDLARTQHYLAPEITLRGEYSTASDIYAFAVVLLEILGTYCAEEGDMALEAWQEKLKAYGVREYNQYCDIQPAKATKKPTQCAHSRIQSLVDYGIACSSISHLLQQNPGLRATASEARQGLMATYGPHNGSTAFRAGFLQTERPRGPDSVNLTTESPGTQNIARPPQTRGVPKPPRVERALGFLAQLVSRRRSTLRRFELPTRSR